MSPEAVMFRRLRPEDSIPAITRLLHAAYRPLAEQGLRFHASYQSDEVTRERLYSGDAFVGVLNEKLVATITRYGPDPGSACALYRRDDVNCLGQFAVRPDLQRRGIGQRLLATMEEQARHVGCKELALDTAEGATHLRAWYERLGFRVVDFVQWDVTNYRSVVMSKKLRQE